MTTNAELYNELRPYLHPGEEVLWAGKPASVHLPKNTFFPALFSIFFMGFSIFWMFGASMAGGIFFLFGIPFFLVGAVLFYKTVFGHSNGLKSSIYAVTETRALITVTTRQRGTTCKEYVFSNLSSVSLENVKDGVGTIRFEDLNKYHYHYGRYGSRPAVGYSPEDDLVCAFFMINDVHSVYHLISERIG